MRYLPFLLIFAVKTAIADSTYVYPAKLSREIPACVPEDKQLNELMITLSGSEPIYGERGKARYKQALDLNNDGSCEVFILPPAYLAGNVPLWQEVWTLKNGTYVRIGQVPQSFPNYYREGFLAEGFWFGEYHNDYPKIFVRYNISNKTSPVYVTSVLAFKDNKYEYDFRSKFSYGRYRELGLKAFQDKNYKNAEKWYLNAYRMEGEKNIDDANNLALVYIKQGKCHDAKELLNKHLADEQAKSSRSISSANFNLSLCDQ